MSADAAATAAGRGLVVISGPSGSGKSTICRALAAAPDVTLSVSATTRPPRRGEVDGRDYLFLARDEFERRIAANAFVEYAQVFGEYYGTPREPLEAALKAGRWVVLDIDVQGAMQVRQACPGALLVFIVPPSREVLAERLRGRGTESPEALARRLAEADRELKMQSKYNQVVVNNVLEDAVARVRALLADARLSQSQHNGG